MSFHLPESLKKTVRYRGLGVRRSLKIPGLAETLMSSSTAHAFSIIHLRFRCLFCICLFDCFGGTGVGTQGLILARKALLPLEPLCQPIF
jgi:hypothetical protein